MSLAHAVIAKVAVGAAAAAVLAGAGAAVIVRQDQGPVRRTPAVPAGQASLPSQGIASGDGEVVIDPGTGAVRLFTAAEGARAGAGAGARTTGRPGSGAQAPAGIPAAPVHAGGTAAAARPPSSLTGPITPPASGGGDVGGSPSGNSGGTGGSPGPASSVVPAVTAPAVPSSASAHSEGSFTVVVPGTAKVSKELCLSGEVNRCHKVTVPALRPVELRVSYSGNAGVRAPTFTTAPCPGGLSVGVSGLTPGATVSATVEGRRVSATAPERGGRQTASLCDA